MALGPVLYRAPRLIGTPGGAPQRWCWRCWWPPRPRSACGHGPPRAAPHPPARSVEQARPTKPHRPTRTGRHRPGSPRLPARGPCGTSYSS
jgi:hypothetical protein